MQRNYVLYILSVGLFAVLTNSHSALCLSINTGKVTHSKQANSANGSNTPNVGFLVSELDESFLPCI